MELTPHDIVRIRPGALARGAAEPELAWVEASLARAPFVVVRRAAWLQGAAPVGVRGRRRNERYAAFLPLGDAIERITPQQLAASKAWRSAPRSGLVPAIAALEEADVFFTGLGAAWGPAGSVGFELASGAETAGPGSDLDVTIRADAPLSVEEARGLLRLQDVLPVRLDMQIETPYGAVSLIEYARGERQVLLRTFEGPWLTADPWSPQADRRIR